MPAKKAVSKNTKSNIAKSAIAGPHNIKNKTLLIAVIVVFAVALGYLFVRLSKAGAYTWTPNAKDVNQQIKVIAGVNLPKNGKPAIQHQNGKLSVYVNSNVLTKDMYCVEGYTSRAITTTPGQPNFGITGWVAYNNGQRQLAGGFGAVAIPAGNFVKCAEMPGSPSDLTRTINVDISGLTSQDVFAIYSITRQGSTNLPPVDVKH